MKSKVAIVLMFLICSCSTPLEKRESLRSVEPSKVEQESDEKFVRSRLELLEDRDLWNSASSVEQDQVLELVAWHLGSAYKFLGARVYKCASQSYRIGSFCHNKTGIILHLIPGGRLDNSDALGIQSAGSRISKVSFANPILIGRSEVRELEWRKGKACASLKIKHEGKLPITDISWNEIQNWLNNLGDGLRLPTELEWEYACRAGTKTRFFWGDRAVWVNEGAAVDNTYCIYGLGPSEEAWADVYLRKKRNPNSFGLEDTLGSVYEWCSDAWNDSVSVSGEFADQTRLKSTKVVRGGCWIYRPSYSTSSSRNHASLEFHNKVLGFRVARSVDLEEVRQWKVRSQQTVAKEIIQTRRLFKANREAAQVGTHLTDH